MIEIDTGKLWDVIRDDTCCIDDSMLFLCCFYVVSMRYDGKLTLGKLSWINTDMKTRNGTHLYHFWGFGRPWLSYLVSYLAWPNRWVPASRWRDGQRCCCWNCITNTAADFNSPQLTSNYFPGCGFKMLWRSRPGPSFCSGESWNIEISTNCKSLIKYDQIQVLMSDRKQNHTGYNNVFPRHVCCYCCSILRRQWFSKNTCFFPPHCICNKKIYINSYLPSNKLTYLKSP